MGQVTPHSSSNRRIRTGPDRTHGVADAPALDTGSGSIRHPDYPLLYTVL
jgi:hypothetical protein